MKTLTLVLGGAITYLAYKAHRRTGARPLRFLAIGFGIVTLGSILAGVADQLFRMDLRIGLLVESVLIVAGFSVILYSLYAE
jgi:hypothetical protein